MMRVMSLPAGFSESTAQVSCPAVQPDQLTLQYAGYLPLFTTWDYFRFSLIYIFTDFCVCSGTCAPALTIVAVTVAFSVISSLVQMGISRRQMELAGKENGMTYAMITGVQK